MMSNNSPPHSLHSPHSKSPPPKHVQATEIASSSSSPLPQHPPRSASAQTSAQTLSVDPRHSDQYLTPPPPPTTSEQASVTLSPEFSAQFNQDHSTLQRPPFQPFFTLVSDASTSSTHHPRQIHYIFSDDDPETLTSACLDSLHDLPSPFGSATNSQSKTNPSSSSNKPTKSKQKQQSSGSLGTRENRVLLLDADALGTSIISAHSMTPHWQILNTTLAPAPTWEGESEPDGNVSREGGMMLRIEGTDGKEIEVDRGELRVGEDGQVNEEDFHQLMIDFEERMRILRTVVDSGLVLEVDDDGEERNKEESAVTNDV